jgi:hypothetical protein
LVYFLNFGIGRVCPFIIPSKFIAQLPIETIES